MALCALTAVGCTKGAKDSEAPASSTASPAASAEAAPQTGLLAAGNDEAVVAAAKEAIACDWGGTGLKDSCEAFKTLRSHDAIKDGKADATLINLLSDGDEKVRWLGATLLAANQGKSRVDPAGSAKIVAAAESEKAAVVATALGRAVGAIDAKATGLGEKVQALAGKSPLIELRRSLAGSMLFRNGESYYDFVAELAKSDSDAEVRKNALSAFWTGTPNAKREQSCKLWLEGVDDKGLDIAAHSAYHAAFWSNGGGCSGEWDELLQKIEARAKAGEVSEGMMASSLGYLYGQAGASKPQKARAIVVAKAIVDHQANKGAARGAALRVVAEREGDAAKAYVKKFAADSEFFVRSVVTDFEAGKIQKKP